MVIPDGKYEGAIVSASSDHTLRVWDVDDAKCVRTLSGHVAEVQGDI